MCGVVRRLGGLSATTLGRLALTWCRAVDDDGHRECLHSLDQRSDIRMGGRLCATERKGARQSVSGGGSSMMGGQGRAAPREASSSFRRATPAMTAQLTNIWTEQSDSTILMLLLLNHDQHKAALLLPARRGRCRPFIPPRPSASSSNSVVQVGEYAETPLALSSSHPPSE